MRSAARIRPLLPPMRTRLWIDSLLVLAAGVQRFTLLTTAATFLFLDRFHPGHDS